MGQITQMGGVHQTWGKDGVQLQKDLHELLNLAAYPSSKSSQMMLDVPVLSVVSFSTRWDPFPRVVSPTARILAAVTYLNSF